MAKSLSTSDCQEYNNVLKTAMGEFIEGKAVVTKVYEIKLLMLHVYPSVEQLFVRSGMNCDQDGFGVFRRNRHDIIRQ